MCCGLTNQRLTNQSHRNTTIFGAPSDSNSRKEHHTNCEAWWWKVMVWGCFAALGPRHLAVIKLAMDCDTYLSVLDKNTHPSVGKVRLNQK